MECPYSTMSSADSYQWRSDEDIFADEDMLADIESEVATKKAEVEGDRSAEKAEAEGCD